MGGGASPADGAFSMGAALLKGQVYSALLCCSYIYLMIYILKSLAFANCHLPLRLR